MDAFRANLPAQDRDDAPRSLDPRLQPTPDYATLGLNAGLAQMPLHPPSGPVRKPRVSTLRLLHFGAMILGIVVASLVSSGGSMNTVWGKFSSPFASPKNPNLSSPLSSDLDLDRQKPQKQAEILLERAVARTDGAPDQIEAQIESRVDAWRGKLKWDSQLGQLATAALNSNDRSVRDSAIEVQLAAYGLTKSESTVDALVRQADSPDHTKKIWALWTLGLLANRGIGTDRAVQVLSAHLKNPDRALANSSLDQSSLGKSSEDARRWAVEGLALVGTTSTIAPLLNAMHDDPSPMVRERAAGSLAESGMLSHNQRLIAVPQLINYSGDPALDAQTRAWAFQALTDITQQRLPNDSAAWRNWYQNNNANN